MSVVELSKIVGALRARPQILGNELETYSFSRGVLK